MHSIAGNRTVDTAPAFVEWEETRAGDLSVRIAQTSREIEAAQALRYRIFFEEMGGSPLVKAHALKRDYDAFDAACDHLLVIDHSLDRVVGTYRLLRRSAMRAEARFYSESEFDIDAIRHEKGEILELGRSCVDAGYRSRAVMQLLWRGIAGYVSQHDVKLMFGCASLMGADVGKHVLSLSYLYHYHMAPVDTCMRALPWRYMEMNLMPRDAIDTKAAFACLPPLIKGYLRAGGHVGHGAVIDAQCNTIDVGMALRTRRLAGKYARRYGAPRE